ncbi:MAG: WecB/TagA/CpsF family glycosyltransferase [Chlorobiaceae bacterium]|nr:WecB/TagA/CpsF family glycosyltransferase [Chlorobiaceae bacterium]NTV60831.1 WecB/TagA/CpsF family glycosyltransferase [Chlorobiaceae bacterium]
MSTAVILGRKEETGRLFRLLEKTYQQVTLAETVSELDKLRRQKQSPGLAVITDSFPENLSIELVNRVRQNLNPENLICLSNDENQEKERVLRSAGLIFFGSYRNFFAFAEKIIKQTLKGRNGNPAKSMDERKERANALEKRLSGNSRGLTRFIRVMLVTSTSFVSEAIARVIELAVSFFILLFLAFPVSFALIFRKLFTGTPVFTSEVITGASSKPVTIHRFNDIGGPLRNIPLFFDLLSGRIALAGVAMKPWGESIPAPENSYIGMMKPGIVSLWDIRKTSKTAHEGLQATEWEYTFRKGFIYDLLLVLRALPVLLYSETSGEVPGLFSIMGLQLDNLTMEEAISVIETQLEEKKQTSIFFVNPDCLNKTVSDREYFDILTSGDFIFPDGIGLIIAGKMLKTPLRENINGTDMLPYLCRMAAAKGERLFLLGGKPGVAETAGRKISEQYGVAVAGTSHGYFDHQSESAGVVEKINKSGASILLVAFGAPLQEKWIYDNRYALKPSVLMGVGGLFDFFSGNIRRAPRWMREIGIEWVYRILQEPGRMWKRYVIGNPLFLYRVMKWKIFNQ